MIYSVGTGAYATPLAMCAQLARVGVRTVVDVRSSPHSRRRGFGGLQLPASIRGGGPVPLAYVHAPNLGGRGDPPSPRTLATLWDLACQSGAPLAIMCAEREPGSCHRHHTIADPLWRMGVTDVRHLWGDGYVLASDLARTMDRDEEPEVHPCP